MRHAPDPAHADLAEATTGADAGALVAELRSEFLALDPADRIALLLELGEGLPETDPASPSRSGWERVTECQSPVHLRVSADPAGTTELPRFLVDVAAPRQAGVTRGFAAIVRSCASGRTAQQIAKLPDDLPGALELSALVSPLRRAGVEGLVARLKRRVRE